jgi:hypothetical protein
VSVKKDGKTQLWKKYESTALPEQRLEYELKILGIGGGDTSV